jgi:hypothetical protein
MSKGYNDSVTLEQRTQALEQLGRQRWRDAKHGAPAYGYFRLMIIPGARHTDLYDRMDVIPFDKITEFFRANLELHDGCEQG